ncbi:sulfotransferase 1C4-like isoform X1 [Panulirus ornatus]|uniref:sulfotransferase 1C4-like isoform X1 n=1 Tax=Panulirus ornatus TaxID=150431 RepID=UPI003A89716F
MLLASGHTAEALQGEELEHQVRDFKGYNNGLVRLNPGRWLFPTDYTKLADKLYDYKFRESDVVVMTWPKCGTTWMQEIVWTMRNNPDLDNPQAMVPTHNRVPFLELDILLNSQNIPPLGEDSELMKAFRYRCPHKDPKDGILMQITEVSPDPRTIKTHLPFSLLNPHLLDTAKVIYVARNPKDVVVSYHHHSRLIKFHDFSSSLDQFVQYFVDDDLVFGPYWMHLKEAWEKREHPNLHFVNYEDLKQNNMVEMRKINEFLGTNLTEEQLQKVAKYTNFSEMKTREETQSDPKKTIVFNTDIVTSSGGFYRKGKAGDWKEHLTPEMEAKIDQWTQQKTKDLGSSFRFSS